jgi:hypothetical protein
MVMKRPKTSAKRRRTLVAVVVFYVVATIVARRRGYSGIGGRTLVRCRQGHLFRTIWVPGVSIKAIRLGWYRAQFCPVGRHWTLVSPVKDVDATLNAPRLSLVPDDLPLP